MTPGNVEFVQVVATMLVVPAVEAAIVRMDEKRLARRMPRRLERAWRPVTRDAVVFATWQFGVLFGCPALVVWFVKTRRSLAGWALGLASAAGLLMAAVVTSAASEAAVDWLGL